MINTHIDISTAFFSDTIYVKCPKCYSLGLVNATLQNKNLAIVNTANKYFHCSKCSYTINEHKTWYGFFVGKILQNCKSCGSNLGFKMKPTKTKTITQKVTCNICTNENEYEIYWEKYFQNKAIDPHFGLDLWLQTNIKSNVLWLYNLEHLEFLKEYVSSKLREDSGRNKYSLITNLPQWIKDAKNRELIVKKLTKLKENFIAETK
jgi:hypothetical protein